VKWLLQTAYINSNALPYSTIADTILLMLPPKKHIRDNAKKLLWPFYKIRLNVVKISGPKTVKRSNYSNGKSDTCFCTLCSVYHTSSRNHLLRP